MKMRVTAGLLMLFASILLAASPLHAGQHDPTPDPTAVAEVLDQDLAVVDVGVAPKSCPACPAVAPGCSFAPPADFAVSREPLPSGPRPLTRLWTRTPFDRTLIAPPPQRSSCITGSCSSILSFRSELRP